VLALERTGDQPQVVYLAFSRESAESPYALVAAGASGDNAGAAPDVRKPYGRPGDRTTL
jgi:hypothetical protein